MRLSIIIPTHNRRHSLRRALQSARQLSSSAGDHELIVVDNASTDGTADVVMEYQPQFAPSPLRLVREDRIGLHHARHTGARAARGEILIFTDDDATFDSGWCDAYAGAFARYPEMAAAGGPVRPVWESDPPEWLRDYVSRSKLTTILSIMEPYTEFRIDPRGFFFGVNMAIRREVLFEVGGFNPEAFGDQWLGDGETGLNRKLTSRGLPIGYVPEAVVYHHIPAERMTVAYFRRRMANQGACDAYTHYHNGIPPWPRLLRSIGGLALRNTSCWIQAVLLRDRCDRHALATQMRSALTQAQVKYLARLIYDKQLRTLVLKQNWLDDVAMLAVAFLSESAGRFLC